MKTTAPSRFFKHFTSDTQVIIKGCEHNMGTPYLIVEVYDDSNPMEAIGCGWTIDTASFDVTISFAIPQSGCCVIR